MPGEKKLNVRNLYDRIEKKRNFFFYIYSFESHWSSNILSTKPFPIVATLLYHRIYPFFFLYFFLQCFPLDCPVYFLLYVIELIVIGMHTLKQFLCTHILYYCE